MSREKVLEIKDLSITFMQNKEETRVVDSIRFDVHKGEVLGIVGESGCGKSVTSLSIMGLLPKKSSKLTGEVLFQGKDLLQLSEKSLRKMRGNDIAMVFQEPMTSLNPLFKIGNQLEESLRVHQDLTKKQAKERVIQILRLVGLPRPEELYDEYPHQLSGGMRQRVMIAMAMICDPKVLIADEPTTALDVTIQAQILKLMKDLNQKLETSIVFITHDLGVVAEMCDRVMVMYAGQVVEEGSVLAIFKNPKHPYTKGLMKSVPDIRNKNERLYSISGQVPRPGTVQKGCLFAGRCEYAMAECLEESPPLYRLQNSHQSRCFLAREEAVQHDEAFA
ncbi:ABC transporter ATP-binding protein [Bacillus sp. UMB0893]|uniref:ABC transporter ATP-binding protein n=2 Tax=Bacillaceae TaxID=186817 RepID=UPI000C7747CE|nr:MULTISPECIES: ABC transporter ATP-binding protein [Bacillaceae]PLR66657.1 peptide ABC transporter ATP-binding protein [Bacillus sp. UMB0893]